MSDIELFKNNPLASSSLFEELMESNKKMMGGGGDNRRISIRGGRFRQIVGGEQQAVSKSDSMNIVVVDAASISRTYYKGAYDPDNPSAPTCWSLDTEKPDPSVPEDQRQSALCRDCPQNIKGSGQGDSRACRFSQRLAVVIEGDWDTIYQLQLPATSIFGKPEGDRMPLQAYIRHLAAHKTVAQAIVTKMYFDEDSETPKLFFKPERVLTEEELEQVLKLRSSEETKQAINFTVSQTDGVQEKPAEEKKSKATKKEEPKAKEPEETEEVEEPKKAEKKAKDDAPEDKEDLQKLVSVWDD